MLSDAAFVAKYQTLIGELLYLSVNAMPEIGFVMSCLTRYMTIPTQKLGQYAKQVVRVAWGRRDAELNWCARAPLCCLSSDPSSDCKKMGRMKLIDVE